MIAETDILNAKILIVDDQSAAIYLTEQILRNAGYQSVTSTRKPAEVFELHRSHRYDLILLDLEMPGMDGFHVMEALQAIEAGSYLPVIVITGRADYKLKALKAGAKDFLGKPCDVAELLARAHNLIEVRLLHREANALYGQVMMEKAASERLLLNVLPASIAHRLKGFADVAPGEFPEMIADSFPQVSVLFADLVDFTAFSDTMSAVNLVRVLNNIFTRFDRNADHRGLEKIKTIGDSYMAVAGLPVASANHATQAAHMALDMLKALAEFRRETGHQLQLRVGIATGAVVAGVIGQRKFLYDLWGDVVNTASRMESHGLPGRVQMTEATRAQLPDSFAMEERGVVEIKAKGPMRTWFLNGRTGAA